MSSNSLHSLSAEDTDLNGLDLSRSRKSSSFHRLQSSMERPSSVLEGLSVNLTQNKSSTDTVANINGTNYFYSTQTVWHHSTSV